MLLRHIVSFKVTELISYARPYIVHRFNALKIVVSLYDFIWGGIKQISFIITFVIVIQGAVDPALGKITNYRDSIKVPFTVD